MIKIDFEFDTKHGKFCDALYLADDHSYSDAEIQSMKENRRDIWIANIDNPPSTHPDYVTIDGVEYKKIEIAGQIVLKPVEVSEVNEVNNG